MYFIVDNSVKMSIVTINKERVETLVEKLVEQYEGEHAMLQVNRSKELRNVQQLQRMSRNLSEKFGDYCSVSVYVACHHYPILEYKIWLGLAHKFATWVECQDKYFELMKGGENGKCG